MDSKKTSAQIIMSLCNQAGISKSELARRLNITPSQISRIVNRDTKTISSDILIALAEEFDVSTDYILGLTSMRSNDAKENVEIRTDSDSNNNMSTKKVESTHIPMLLMSSPFPLGKCLEFIESIEDIPQKEMTYAEYYYFSGQHEKAVKYSEKYLKDEDIILKLSASLIYTFANLSLDRSDLARQGLGMLKEHLEKAMSMETDKKTMAHCVFVASASHTLLHLPVGDIPPLANYLTEFSKGMQLWGAYVLAHEAYLSKEYGRSLGIVQACIMTCDKIYPIAMIYLYLVAAMDCMNMMETEKAREYFMKAWELSMPDDLLEGIGEHHGLLQGLIEK